MGYIACDAEYDLGNLYRYGEGVTTNNVLATHWFVISANNGSKSAIQALSDMYNSKIQLTDYTLGEMYQHGWGVTQSDTKAKMHYQISANAGDSNAKDALQNYNY